MRYDALAFDTGGTVLDWHGSLVDELARVPAWHGVPFDRHEFANAWRRGTMKGIVGQVRPAFNTDDVHLRSLDETARAFGLPVLDAESRQTSGAPGTVCVPGPISLRRSRRCASACLWSRSRCCRPRSSSTRAGGSRSSTRAPT